MFGYKYHLLSPHMVSNDYVDFFNDVYASWKKSFTKVLVEDAGGNIDPDDFFRCDHVGVITFQDKIVGHCLMTMFDLRLDSSLEHHYIQALKPETIQNLKKENINRLISIEYLNIMPEFRKSSSDIRWAEVMIGIALKLMDESKGDALLGMPRIDIKVNQIGFHMNFKEIQEPVQKMKYSCAIMMYPKEEDRHFSNPPIEKAINHLIKTMHVDEEMPFHSTKFKKSA